MRSDKKEMPVFFNPKKIGLNIREVGTDYLDVESRKIETKWYRDESGDVDIFLIYEKDKEIIKQQVFMMGVLVEWSQNHGVRTGVIVEHEVANQEKDRKLPGSETVYFDKRNHQHSLKMATDVIKSMTLDAGMKTALLKNYSHARLSVRDRQSFAHFLKTKKYALRSWVLKIISCFRR